MFSWMFWLLHLILEQSDVLLIEKIIWLVSKDVSPLYFILSFPKLSLLRRHKAAFKGEFGSYRIVTKIPKYPMSALGWSWLEVFYHIFYLIWSKFFLLELKYSHVNRSGGQEVQASYLIMQLHKKMTDFIGATYS